MRLLHPIEFDDRAFQPGEVVYVLPGTARLLERRHFAMQEERGVVSIGVRAIVETPGTFESPEPNAPTIRTAAGY